MLIKGRENIKCDYERTMYEDGFYRDDIYENGGLSYSKTYNPDGELNDYKDEPGVVEYDEGVVYKTIHYKNGKIYTDGVKPSMICYRNYEKNDIHYVRYHENGIYGRSGDQPAEIMFSRNGDIHYTYCLNDEHHRVGKPAYLTISKDGTIIYEEWWENGDLIDEVNIERYKRKDKRNKILNIIKDDRED